MTLLSIDTTLLTATTRTVAGRSEFTAYGTTETGPIQITAPAHPYLFVPPAILPHIRERYQVDNEVFSALDGTELRKLTFSTQPSVDSTRKLLHERGVVSYEGDIRLRDRFLMDNGLYGSIVVTGEFRRRGRILQVHSPTFGPSSWKPTFSICSLDIETSVSDGTLLCIGVHLTASGKDYCRIFMRGDGEGDSTLGLTFHRDEATLLRDFLRWFEECDPDLIIGWNVIGFDLAFLLKRAEILEIELTLGRDNSSIEIGDNVGRFRRATIAGRIVFDGPQLLRNSFHTFERYSLEFVAREVLGEGKLIGPEKNRGFEIERLYASDPYALARYNLRDCILVTKIFSKLGLIELSARRGALSGLLLDQVGLSTAAFDHLMLPRLHQRGFAAPELKDIRQGSPATGGHVLSPTSGLYEGVIGLDFQSLYPSIIRTFFIDPLSRACRALDPVITPSGHSFSKSNHILPEFIGSLLAARARAKSEGDAILSQAIKILMNSFYGVMGSPGSRLYHPDLPQAITQTGQWILLQSKAWIERAGHTVLYGDTDSLFVLLSAASNDLTPTLRGQQLAKELTNYWQDRISKEFGVTSHLIAEFKQHYLKFLLPRARGSSDGVKKRYAGLVQNGQREDVEFVGLEAVRSDWTPLAREFQRDLYARVFKGEEIGGWIRDLCDHLRAGEFNAKLVYRKRLHRDPDQYGKSPPPYVRAAQLMARPSRDVRYIMTTTGPVPIEQNPSNPDFTHYIEKQLKPLADSVLEVIGSSFDALVKPVQLRLF